MRWPFRALLVLLVASPASPDQSNQAPVRGRVDRTLRIHLMAGQSNVTGQAHVYQESDDFLAANGDPDATSLEFLINDAAYRATLDPATYPVLNLLNESWLTTRQQDAWGRHVQASTGLDLEVRTAPSTQVADWVTGETTLGTGFGGLTFVWSRFGPEVSMGRVLEFASEDPQYIFKVDTPGTTLDGDWRPPSASGPTGSHYLTMRAEFGAFLASLEADLRDDGVLNDYGMATSYEFSSLVWFHGTNNRGDGQANLDLYRDLLVDLVEDVRFDFRLPELPVVIVEHPQLERLVAPDGTLTGADGTISQAKLEAIDILNLTVPDRALFVPVDDLLSSPALNDPFHFEKRAENYLEIGWRIARKLQSIGAGIGQKRLRRPPLGAALSR